MHALSFADVTVEKNDMGGIIGVMGKDAGGQGALVLRDGDVNDGAFDKLGEQDTKAYPFVAAVYLFPVDAAGKPDEGACGLQPDKCPIYYGYGGKWAVTALPSGDMGAFEGTLSANAIVGADQENCWDQGKGGKPCDPLVGGAIETCFVAK